MKSLRDCVILLTGASRGMGASMARRLAAEGARLALVARSAGPLDALAAEVGGRAYPLDLADLGALPGLVDRVVGELGGLQGIVHNAGVETFGHMASADPGHIEQTLTLNLTAPMLLTRYALPALLAAPEAQVVFLGSTAGLMGTPYGAAYAASKAGLLAASLSLRMEFAHTAVGFSAVLPGFVHGAGMHEVHKQEVGAGPALAGGTTVDAVVAAVVRALYNNPAEVIVNSPPMRPLRVFSALAPGLSQRLAMAVAGPYMRRLADHRQGGAR
jgi:short-subunit dehydrogenase